MLQGHGRSTATGYTDSREREQGEQEQEVRACGFACVCLHGIHLTHLRGCVLLWSDFGWFCVEPGVGLNDPDGSLPTQDVPWVCDLHLICAGKQGDWEDAKMCICHCGHE